MTIARVYYAPFQALTFGGTGDRSFWEIKAPADRQVVIHAFSVTSDYTTDERARLVLKRYSTDGTGTAVTEVKANGDNSLTAEAAVIHTVTPGTAGDIIAAWRWSQQGELLFLPTPEMRIVIPAGSRLGLNLVTALGAARAWSGYLCWEEL